MSRFSNRFQNHDGLSRSQKRFVLEMGHVTWIYDQAVKT